MSEPISFTDGMVFAGSNCNIDGIGHDTNNPIIGYDFKGTVAKICPRPWCMEIMDEVAVDDLSREEFDELRMVIKGVSEYRDE